MMRTVYLEGEMGYKFGTSFQIYAETVAEALRCLEVNLPDFKKYFIDCHEKDIGFFIDVGDNNLDYEQEVLIPFNKGDITITPAPAGAKSGIAKILAAIAIFAFAWFALPGMLGAANLGAAMAMGGWHGVVAMGVVGMATNLAIMGLQQVMAPDPATDQEAPESYLFNGAEQNVIEGDPVPLLYGRLRVPGVPMSFETAPSRLNGSMGCFGANGTSSGESTNEGGFEAMNE